MHSWPRIWYFPATNKPATKHTANNFINAVPSTDRMAEIATNDLDPIEMLGKLQFLVELQLASKSNLDRVLLAVKQAFPSSSPNFA